MDCDKCQELLSDFVDGELTAEDGRLLAAHIDECLSCCTVREDIDAIVSFCREHRGEYDPVPNSNAMWVRIRNSIDLESSQFNVVDENIAETRTGFWPRLSRARWQLSFIQLAATVSAIAIAVSIVTSVGIQRLKVPPFEDDVASRESYQAIPPGEDRRNMPQMGDIDYWSQRVEQRKARWSPQMRDAFERNLNAIDRLLDESTQQLKQHPHDEITEEMVNAALNQKMALLKDFSEQ